MIDNLSLRALRVLQLASKEAGRFNHNFVGTEHLLLGLIKLGEGTAVTVLQKLGLSLKTLREEVEKQVGKGPDQKIRGKIPLTPRVKKVLALAEKEAVSLGHSQVGTEHILLGILREGDGISARVLKNLDVNLEETRQEILMEKRRIGYKLLSSLMSDGKKKEITETFESTDLTEAVKEANKIVDSYSKRFKVNRSSIASELFEIKCVWMNP